MAITFIHSADLTYDETHIDCIYAAFFFDLFSPAKIEGIVKLIEAKHPNKPTWHIADFNLLGVTKYRVLRKFQLKASILFFRLTTNHSLKHLPPLFSILKSIGLKTLANSTLSNNFLRIEVFKRL
jgi:hypothetical protein